MIRGQLVRRRVILMRDRQVDGGGDGGRHQVGVGQ